MTSSGRSSRRPREMPTKGDRREQEILDAAEHLLDAVGIEQVTVEAIASQVGITRAALYFYFRSKYAVYTELVRRLVGSLHSVGDALQHEADYPARQCIADVVRGAEEAWREHGQVMRMAVDLTPNVAEVAELWTSSVASSVEHLSEVLARTGVPDDDSSTGAHAIAESMCWMTERTMYWASKDQDPDALARAGDTCLAVWFGLLPD